MFGRLRAPVVITTTVHANADELQVSTTVEENTGDASAFLAAGRERSCGVCARRSVSLRLLLMSAATAPSRRGALLQHISIHSTHMLVRHALEHLSGSRSRCSFVFVAPLSRRLLFFDEVKRASTRS